MIAMSLILFGSFFRLIPHVSNFTPLGATAVLGGRTLPRKKAIVLVLATMIVSDALLAFTRGYPFMNWVTPFVYAGFALQVVIAGKLRNHKGGSLYAALFGAFLFFVISNFGVWAEGVLYPRTLSGLVNCYVMALPFFKSTLLADLVWTAVLIMAYEAISHRAYAKLTQSHMR